MLELKNFIYNNTYDWYETNQAFKFTVQTKKLEEDILEINKIYSLCLEKMEEIKKESASALKQTTYYWNNENLTVEQILSCLSLENVVVNAELDRVTFWYKSVPLFDGHGIEARLTKNLEMLEVGLVG